MQDAEIKALKDRILNQGLTGVPMIAIVEQLCETISAAFAIHRMSIGMQTLHPLVEAHSIRWIAGTGIDMIQSEHGYSEKEDWLSSPISFMFKNELANFRCRLDQPGDWQQFPLLMELAQEGCSEYYATLIPFSESFYPMIDETDGMLASWATKNPDGFADTFENFVDQIKPALGIVSKLTDRENITVNIVEAYLGNDAGSRVLKGQIERGELVTIDAIIWYSDLRQSTWLAENLTNQDFLDTLNTYFECTADSVLEHRGEVLRFIGDAVLAIFPIEKFETAQHAAQAAWQAASLAQQRIDEVNSTRRENQLVLLNFGLGLHAGSLDYGNIGVSSRLEFSVIGTVANEVARIEGLTKTLDEPVLVSESFAKLLDIDWRCMGPQPMKGVKNDPVIFASP